MKPSTNDTLPHSPTPHLPPQPPQLPPHPPSPSPVLPPITSPSILPSLFHQFGGIRLQPCCFFSVFYDGFWLAPGGVKLKMTTSGPNPSFWAWVWARCGHVWCKPLPEQPRMTSSGPNPRSGREPGLGPDAVILGVLGGNPRK